MRIRIRNSITNLIRSGLLWGLGSIFFILTDLQGVIGSERIDQFNVELIAFRVEAQQRLREVFGNLDFQNATIEYQDEIRFKSNDLAADFSGLYMLVPLPVSESADPSLFASYGIFLNGTSQIELIQKKVVEDGVYLRHYPLLAVEFIVDLKADPKAIEKLLRSITQEFSQGGLYLKPPSLLSREMMTLVFHSQNKSEIWRFLHWVGRELQSVQISRQSKQVRLVHIPELPLSFRSSAGLVSLFEYAVGVVNLSSLTSELAQELRAKLKFDHPLSLPTPFKELNFSSQQPCAADLI